MNTFWVVVLVGCLCLPFLGMGLVLLALLAKRQKAKWDTQVLQEWQARDEGTET